MLDITFRQLLKEAADKLKTANVPDPRFDARALIVYSFHLDSAHFLLYESRKISSIVPEVFSDEESLKKAFETFEYNLSRREKREPLQQILGTVGFYGLDFRVTKDVLCPRADTETLIDAVLGNLMYDNIPEVYRNEKKLVDMLTSGRQIVEKEDASLLDVCTGSGCIAVTLARFGHFKRITAVDISDPALKIATYNRDEILGQKEKCRVVLFKSDMFSEVRGKFDVIVSNPPYIPSSVVDTLEPEVRDFEPRIALDGTEDGLRFYRILSEEAPKHLKEGGYVFFEIGYDQGDAVSELLNKASFKDVMVLKDFSQNDRVVMGHL
ncbi:peptide chain release factor N(5)-glutamine methyltransferase [Oribacterium sp. WCC10]|uniref:peptide chain release factor N(5)-glutamine methyltransferase n=1 Tax=Oribacterium sp. WCC10 TaxID=1855343 RepID=UPI0008E4C048|nr:peptide chain release factor N(5)-glutamine methyltransferase [Oribacterium sp. WCC10]SFG13703.1 release factor glutamine methyltransferase [Oribacterium sp. WCC10]